MAGLAPKVKFDGIQCLDIGGQIVAVAKVRLKGRVKIRESAGRGKIDFGADGLLRRRAD